MQEIPGRCLYCRKPITFIKNAENVPSCDGCLPLWQRERAELERKVTFYKEKAKQKVG